jgi:hypothetical protein
MSTPTVPRNGVGFMEIAPATTPTSTGADEAILRSYLGIMAYYFVDDSASHAQTPLAAIDALPALIQVANVQRTVTSETDTVDARYLAHALCQAIVQALQKSVDEDDLAASSRTLAATMLQQVSATRGGSTEATLIVFDMAAPDTPVLGVLDCVVSIAVSPPPKGHPFARQKSTLSATVSWVAFSVNDAQQSEAQSFIDSMADQQRILAPSDIPALQHVTVD